MSSSLSRRNEIINELSELLKDDIVNSDLYKIVLDLQNNGNKPDYSIENFRLKLQEFGIFYENNTDKTYYSAYANNMSIDDFKSKNAIWLTERFDQAILHPLNNADILDPVIFEFKLKNFYYLNSFDKDNKTIFDKIFLEIKKKFLKYINTKNEFKLNNEEIFIGGNNKYILYILNVINQYFPNNIFYISGYQNLLDQHEIALLDFHSLVNPSSIIKYQYTKIVYKDNTINLPLSLPRHIGPEIGTGYTDSYDSKLIYDKYRMVCNGNLKIYYKIINGNENGNENIFDCSTLTKEDFFKNKYIKYKKKYLQLKMK